MEEGRNCRDEIQSIFLQDGHRLLYRNCIKSPTKLRMWDPCPFGQPNNIDRAHMDFLQLGSPRGYHSSCVTLRLGATEAGLKFWPLLLKGWDLQLGVPSLKILCVDLYVDCEKRDIAGTPTNPCPPGRMLFSSDLAAALPDEAAGP